MKYTVIPFGIAIISELYGAYIFYKKNDIKKAFYFVCMALFMLAMLFGSLRSLAN